MARIRTVKPEFWRNMKLSSVSLEAHLLAVGLLNAADDEGYFNANPMLVKADVFPLRDLSVSIHGVLSELSRIGYIDLYDGFDGEVYGHIVNFTVHQKINRPTKSRIRTICKSKQLLEPNKPTSTTKFSEPSVNAHGALTEGSSQERKGKEQGKEVEQGKESIVELEAEYRGETLLASASGYSGKSRENNLHNRQPNGQALPNTSETPSASACADKSLLPIPLHTPEQNSRPEAPNSIGADVARVFDFWREHMSHPRAKLDAKRKKNIQARLKDGYSVDDLRLAVKGCKCSPFHMGENSSGTVYDDIELICRESKNVDKFIFEYERSDGKLLDGATRAARHQAKVQIENIGKRRGWFSSDEYENDENTFEG